MNKLYSYVGVFRACQYNNVNIDILYSCCDFHVQNNYFEHINILFMSYVIFF